MENVGRAFSKMMSVFREKKVRYEYVKKIYDGMYVPIVTYASGEWGDKIIARDKFQLLSGHRRCVLKMIRGYRTISGDATCVIGGVIPVDLVVERSYVLSRVRMKGMLGVERKANYERRD